MQVIYQNKNKKDNSKRTDPVGIIICIRKTSKYLKEKCFRKFGDRSIEIYNNRVIFDRLEKRIQKRR